MKLGLYLFAADLLRVILNAIFYLFKILLGLQVEGQLLDHFAGYFLLIEPKGDGSVKGEHRNCKLEEGVDSLLEDKFVLVDDDLYFLSEGGEFADTYRSYFVDNIVRVIGADIYAEVSPAISVKVPRLLSVDLSIHS